MPKTYTPPQAVETTPRPLISLKRVKSSQLASAGHDAATNTLALQFRSKDGRTAPVYHYHDFSAEDFAKFMGSDSLGTYFGANIKGRPFKKYPAEAFPELEPEA